MRWRKDARQGIRETRCPLQDLLVGALFAGRAVSELHGFVFVARAFQVARKMCVVERSRCRDCMLHGKDAARAVALKRVAAGRRGR